jgi:mannosyltransferase
VSQVSPGQSGKASSPADPAGPPATAPPRGGGTTGAGNGVMHPEDAPAHTGTPADTDAARAELPAAAGAGPVPGGARAEVPAGPVPGVARAEVPAGPVAGGARAGDWQARAAGYAPAGAAALAMVVLGWWGLARDSAMGNDEVATRWAALLSLRDLAHLLNNQDAVHGLYYLLMHVWAAVGSSPEVLRIPSVLAMAAAVALVAILTGRLTGSGWAGLFAGLVMALTPMISFYAQTARSYAMVLACVVGATLVLVRALGAEAAGPGRRAERWWLGYAALIVLGGYLNEMSLLVLAAHAVTVLVARYGRQVVRRWTVTAVVSAMLVGPLVLLSIRQNGEVRWIPRPGLDALRMLFHDYFGATTGIAVLLLVCAVLAVLPSGRGPRRPATVPARAVPAGPGSAAGPVPPWWRGGISLPSVAAPLLVLPALLLIGESLVGRPLYVDRYVLYGEAGAAMLAGAGMWRAGRWLGRAAGRWRGRAAGRPALMWVPGVAVCVCALVLQLGPLRHFRTPGSRLFNFGGPSQYVGVHARQGDGVMFFGNLFRKARLGYPGDYTKTTDFGVAESPQQAGSFRGTDKKFPAVYPLMLEYQRIWVIGHVPSRRLPDPLLRAESVVLKQRFRRIAERRFKGIVVTLWQRR